MFERYKMLLRKESVEGWRKLFTADMGLDEIYEKNIEFAMHSMEPLYNGAFYYRCVYTIITQQNL